MRFLVVSCACAAALAAIIAFASLGDRPPTSARATQSEPVDSPELRGVVFGESEPSAKTEEAPFVPVTQSDVLWLDMPPPADIQTVGLKADDGSTFVGIVYPPATKPGDTVETTIVAMNKPGTNPAVFEGMVLVDPQGRRHAVDQGALITFTAAAAGVWSLLDRDGKTVARSEVTLDKATADLWQGTPQSPAIICRPNASVVVPGRFDGDIDNTAASNARVIAENPRAAVLAMNADAPIGKTTIAIRDGDFRAQYPCHITTVTATGPREMRIGEAGLLTLTIRGFEGMSKEHMDAMRDKLALRYRNSTPEVISLGSEESGFKMVDFAAVNAGIVTITVPFKALAAGRFVLTAWLQDPPLIGGGRYCQGFQCCSTACAPCGSSWGFCDDRGRTNCSRIGGRTGTHCAACMGGLCNHRGSSACGHWWCACPFGFCVC